MADLAGFLEYRHRLPTGLSHLDGIQTGNGDILKEQVRKVVRDGSIQRVGSGAGMQQTNGIPMGIGIITHGINGIALGEMLSHLQHPRQVDLRIGMSALHLANASNKRNIGSFYLIQFEGISYGQYQQYSSRLL